MLKNVSLTLSIILEIFCIAFIFWFGNITGFQGMLDFHPKYEHLYTLLTILIIFPILAYFFYMMTQLLQGHSKILLTSLFCCSIFCYIVSIATPITGIIIINVRNHSFPKNHAELKNPLNLQNPPELKHIAISSDPHWHAPTCSENERSSIIKNISKRNYDAFFILGDIVEYGDNKNSYEEPINTLNEQLPKTPILAIMGNHDALVNGKRVFNTYFRNNPKATPYFRFDSGKTHFMVINMLWGTQDFNIFQKKWLITQLKSIPKEEKIIVMSHCFYVASGSIEQTTKKRWYDLPDMISKICPIFEEYNVDLVLSGHLHSMQTLKKDGVSYAIIGSMGGNLEDNPTYNSTYINWLKNDFGWIDLTIEQDKITLIYYDYNGNELHKEEVEC